LGVAIYLSSFSVSIDHFRQCSEVDIK